MPMPRDAVVISLLIFSAVLSAWLGIAGPININVSTLSDFLYNWQTFIGAMIALFAAWFTLSAQSAQRRYDFLRQRSQQLNRELTLLTEAASAARLTINSLYYLANAPNGRPFLDYQGRAAMEVAETGLEIATKSFRDGIGPAWGSVKTQQARSDFLDAAYSIATKYHAILRKWPLGIEISWADITQDIHDIQTLDATLSKTQNEFWKAIRAEGQRIAPLIEALERKLLKIF